MKIGIDCRRILNPGYGQSSGAGYYTYYLVRSLLRIDQENEYVLFFDERVVETKEFERSNTLVRFFPYSKYGTYLPFAYSQMLIAAFLQREKLDVYHSPANMIPLQYSGAAVQTAHDLSLFSHPQWYPSGWLSRMTLSRRVLMPQSLKRATRVIAASESTKKDLETLFKLHSSKIDVVYEGYEESGPHATASHPSFQELADKYTIEQKYLLFVGTIEQKKNLVTLIKAFDKVLGDKAFSRAGLQLVIAGRQGYGHSDVLRQIERVNKRHGMGVINYVGYILHEEKLTLLRNALCFLSPVWHEAFGRSVLEAMAQGCPVLASNIRPTREVLGEVGLYMKPDSEQDIANTIIRFLTGANRETFVKRGIERSKKFSWDQAAKQTLNVYQRAIGEYCRTKTKKSVVNK